MRILPLMLPAGAVLAVGLAGMAPSVAEEEGPEVARMFRARCAACHTVPDRSLRGDRAWLGQVNRTS